MATKLISVVSPCFNEEQNVELLYSRVKAVFDQLPQYRYEHIYIDNASTDKTVERLKEIANKDKNIKVIINMRNFGHIRSPHHAFLQARGDAVISMCSDLQDPPELIPEFLKKWEDGARLVVAVKTSSKENPLVYALRTMYYRLLNKVANVKLIDHFTGFGLYDKSVVRELRKIDDRYPYMRGLVCELGFEPQKIEFEQPARKFGKTHNNLWVLYDMAMLGLTSHSLVPMRLATIAGFSMAAMSLLVGLFYLCYKLVYWSNFEVGVAPLVIGMFWMFSIQLAFIGLLGEYVGAVHTQVLKRPLVVERERINFDSDDPESAVT